jgi:peptide/nickel transport system substrate-binding protein
VRERVVFHLCVLAACALFIPGCGGNQRSAESVSAFPRSQTLYVGGFQWGPPTSFNPLHGSPAWPATGNINLVYESLFGYDLIDGTLEPIIGSEYSLEGHTLRVSLHQNAAWQDGTPLTAEDVVYTFELHKTYNTHLHSHWNYVSAVRAVDEHTVEFTLSEQNYNRLVVLDIIGSTPILPKKVFHPLETTGTEWLSNDEILATIREFKNDSTPLGSGPYTLHTYSDQKIVLERVDTYWGNETLYEGRMPAPRYIVHMAYSGNDKFNLALQQGDLDISQTFCPQIWNKFDKGVGTWYDEEPYYVPGIIPALLMCLEKPPFDDIAFRRAAAHAIDYDKIKTIAVYGYTPELQPGFILPFGNEQRYFSRRDAREYGCGYAPATAKKILKEAGYRWGEDGLLIDPEGTKIPTLYAQCPSGWTDWETTIKIAVAGMREIGIDVREKFVEYPIWDKNLKNGLFDFIMRTPHPEQSPSTPWARFEKVMSSRHYRPVGEVMYENEGRYRNPLADSLLLAIPRLEDEEALAEGYRALNRLFMQEMPVIPLMYRPWLFYQFSTKHWRGFPTADDPYAPPQCLMVAGGVSGLWGIEPAEGK